MNDRRNVETGLPIPKENYCDQPYVVKTRDGAWLCVLTTGPGLESRDGQHVVATISSDHGKSWTPLIDIEPASEHISSWVTPLIVPGGRVYAFYCYDADLESRPHGGWMAYRYSDDNGRTWSERHCVPMRNTRRDRENASGGRRQFFWCIDKPVVSGGKVYFGIPKLTWGRNLSGGESWVICSDNVLTESDPDKIHWALLPEGDEGVHNPDLGPVQEEQNMQVLSDGSLYMAMRTTLGHPAYSISRDGGKTWTKPEIMRYADGRRIKTPRACPRVWKTSNGKFLFWFHNNSAGGFGSSVVRNPVWVSGGIEVDGEIQWSQPEVLLYSLDQTLLGMSYPDLIEEDGRYWVTETQKMFAWTHEIDPALLEAVWTQHENRSRATGGVVYESDGALKAGDSFEMPVLPELDEGGFTIELWVRLEQFKNQRGFVLLDGFGQRNSGVKLTAELFGGLKWELHDGQQNRRWHEIEGIPGPRSVAGMRGIWTLCSETDLIRTNRLQHLVLIVDGASKVVSQLVDGRLCDGAHQDIKGWGRLHPYLRHVNGERIYRVGKELDGRIEKLRVYSRPLLTSEAVGNFRAGAE